MFRKLASLIVVAIVIIAGLSSCKKHKSSAPTDGDTRIETIELTTATPSESVYGLDFTFKLSFSSADPSTIAEYGIAYSPWISNSGDVTCLIGGPATYTLKFDGVPQPGIILSRTVTLSYADFNDANYRAYAILRDGTVVYGEIKHIAFA